MRLKKTTDTAEHNIASLLILAACLAVITFAMEIFVFNSTYQSIPADERGVRQIGGNQVTLNNISENNGVYTLDGTGASFTITMDLSKVNAVEFTIVDMKDPFQITVSKLVNGTEVSLGANRVDSVTSSLVRIQDPGEGEALIVRFPEAYGLETDHQQFSFDDLRIDNELVFSVPRMMLLFGIMFCAAVLIVWRRYFSEHLDKAYLLIAAFVGIYMVFFIPPGYGFDENSHFVKSYQVSSLDFLSTNNGVLWPEGFVAMRDLAQISGYTSDNYSEFLNFIQTRSSLNEYVYADLTTTCANYFPITYIFSALGLALGRLFGISYPMIFYLGRLFNFVFVSAILYFCIREARVGKRIFFMLSLVPELMFLNSCYSVDPLTIAGTFCFFVLFFNTLFGEKEYFGTRQIVVYIISVLFFTAGKITYFPLAFLLWCVPADRFKARGKNHKGAVWLKWLLPLTGVVFAGITYAFSMQFPLVFFDIPGADSAGQISWILHNIPSFVYVIVKWTITHSYYFFTDLGNSLGMAGNIGKGYGMLLWIFLFYMSFLDSRKENNLSSQQNTVYKIWSSVVILGIVTLILTALYISFTAVSAGEIKGVQGRYFLPLMPLFLMLFHSNKIQIGYDENKLNFIAELAMLFVNMPALLLILKQYVS